jgi:hypothetical protein
MSGPFIMWAGCGTNWRQVRPGVTVREDGA